MQLIIRVGKLAAKTVAWVAETFLYKILPFP